MTWVPKITALDRALADKYSPRKNGSNSSDVKPGDLLKVAVFLAWSAHNGDFYGMVWASDALESFSRIVGLPVEVVKSIGLGDQ